MILTLNDASHDLAGVLALLTRSGADEIDAKAAITLAVALMVIDAGLGSLGDAGGGRVRRQYPFGYW